MHPRATLLDELAEFAYQYRPEQPFQLASGAFSDEYLDCRKALSRPRALAAVGNLVLRHLLQTSIKAIGGLTMGADPIAHAVCFASYQYSSTYPINWFSIRKEAKDHGKGKQIEGSVESGTHVCIVDDVCTTGGSTIKAIEAARAFGLLVSQVIVLVDRQQDAGIDNIRKAAGEGVIVNAMYTKEEIKARYQDYQIMRRPVPDAAPKNPVL